MPLVFQTRPGQVVMLDDPAMACATRFLSLDPGITYDAERSIVTRVTVSQQVNVQFLHSLGSLVHVYVFGDRMGQVSLSGLSFACGCGDEQFTFPAVGTLAASGPPAGAELMLAWYKRNRASRRAEPCRVTLGRTVIEGFVTAFSEDVVDPSLKMVQWGVTLATMPEDD